MYAKRKHSFGNAKNDAALVTIICNTFLVAYTKPPIRGGGGRTKKRSYLPLQSPMVQELPANAGMLQQSRRNNRSDELQSSAKQQN